MLAALFVLQAALATPSSPAETAEVVVVAQRRRCTVSIADRIIADKEFKARAKEWARGTPVRIVAPRGSDYRCLAKIMFRLQRYGVSRAEIVSPGQP